MIHQILASDPQFEVVGFATDGREAVEAVASLAPHVVTMDVKMPHADGLWAVERIMAERPTPILMISSHTREGSVAALRALELGAVDFVAKPSGSVDPSLDGLRGEIIRKVKVAARVRPVRNAGNRKGGAGAATPVAFRVAKPAPQACHPSVDTTNGTRITWTPILIIAASTGGPVALLNLIPELPRDLPASVLIIQHMTSPFTTHFARELAARSNVPVKEAEDGEGLKRGVVYVAPGSQNLFVTAGGRAVLRPPQRPRGECPSADLAMVSVAQHSGPMAVAVVLTGMGRDGAEGAEAIRRAGGIVIAQDESSSVVYGMPRAAIETGCVDAVFPLDSLSKIMVGCLEELDAHLRKVDRGS